MMPDSYGPNERPDATPPHDNVIRRFREELRMDRPEFAVLIGAKIDTLRVWESGKSKPRGEAALRIVLVAERNDYPLDMKDFYGRDAQTMLQKIEERADEKVAKKKR